MIVSMPYAFFVVIRKCLGRDSFHKILRALGIILQGNSLQKTEGSAWAAITLLLIEYVFICGHIFPFSMEGYVFCLISL